MKSVYTTILKYNGKELKLLYNEKELKEIISHYTKHELIGDNVFTTKLNSINSSSISKFLGYDATSIIDNEQGITMNLGSSNDYWYKLDFNLEPNTNYKITINIDTDLDSSLRILGVRTGNESVTYQCDLGYIYVKNLVDKIGILEFTTPSVLGTSSGIYLGCLSNTSTSPYLTINTITIEEIVYKNVDHMRWIAIGDSISAGVGTTKTYIDFITEETGLIVARGNRISGGSVSLIGDGTLAGSGYTFMPDFISYDVKEIYARPLLVTIWLGTNDHLANVPIGNDNSNDKTEFWGALNYFLPKLRESYPNAYIIYFTPGKKRNISANTAGHTLLDYVNTIKDACNKYNINCCDLYNDTYDLIDVNNMTSDGLHFNLVGHETIISPYIKSKISEIVLNDKGIL